VACCLQWCCLPLLAAGSILPPLASISAPPCPKRSGVRSERSGLVQHGDAMVSVTAQVTREDGNCSISAALWVTQSGVSQQVDLTDSGANTFSIVDIAPDGSGVLVSAVGDGHLTKAAFVSFADSTAAWLSLTDLLGLGQCHAQLEPQGFADGTRIVVAMIPPPAEAVAAGCPSAITFYSVNRITQAVSQMANPPTISRFAAAVSGPAQSCKTDPDVIAACYTARARLAVSGDGQGYLLWPVGGRHVMAVPEGMVPEDLSSKVSSAMRVYATMLICPVTGQMRSARQVVCVDSASDLKSDPIK